MHPTKAVVAWGKNAEEIIKGHENSKTPFTGIAVRLVIEKSK